ncbi:MAG: TMEM175 family protein, partial [Myxococcota bacterium]
CPVEARHRDELAVAVVHGGLHGRSDPQLSRVATGICFATVFMIWNAHYTFFRRYDMLDGWTVFLNSCLLFIVLLSPTPSNL